MGDMSAFFSVFIFTFLTSLFIILLYVIFVLPNDIIRMEIIECMEGDRSRDQYELCAEEVLIRTRSRGDPTSFM